MFDYLSAQYIKNDAAKITKLGIEMFHDESRRLIYFGVKRSNVKVMSHKYNTAGRRGCLHSCECWLLLVLLLQHIF